MLRKRRTKTETDIFGTALTLMSADGSVLASFTPELVQEYRRMLTGLSFRSALPQRLALVAALRGEGVTYTSLVMATTLASDLDCSICVVELNWWSPGMQDQLAGRKRIKRKKMQHNTILPESHPVLQSQGVAGILSGKVTVDEALIPTNLANLHLLPAGAVTPELRSPVARSAELGEVLDSLTRRFNHLIFDLPAVRATSDAVALVSHCDAACVVARQGVTPVAQVRLALDEIKHITMLGVILNRTRTSTPRWIYNMIPQE